MWIFSINLNMFLLIKLIVSISISFQHVFSDNECSDSNRCPLDKPFCSKAGCVFECPSPFYVNGTNCVSTCGDSFVQNSHCVKHCPDKWFVRERLRLVGSQSYIEKHCILSCDGHEYIYEDMCVRACPSNYRYISNQLCRSECPGDMQLILNVSVNSVTYHRCVNECSYFIDGVYCTMNCSDGKLVLNSTCVDHCPESYPFISEKKCVQKCPDTTVYVENSTCLNNCTDEKPFYLNQTCTEMCPETFFITNRNGVIYCEHKCRSTEYTYRDTCLDSCADDGKRNYFLFYLNQTCVEECPPSLLTLKHDNYYVGRCVASCTDDEYVYNNTCVSICPADTVMINSSCENKCPENIPFTCLVEKDGECSGDNPHPNAVLLKICVVVCPKNTVSLNNTCIRKCPDPYRESGQKCVLECPDTSPLTQNRTVTYKTWTRSMSFYNFWTTVVKTDEILECVPECRKGMVSFNSSCIYECPYSHRFVLNGTCTTDACTMKYMYNNSTNIICTDKCDDDYYIYNETCVKKCPNNVYITNKTCSLQTCQTKYKYNTSSAVICTDDCSKYGFAHDETCDNQCPFYVFQGTCMLMCPDNHALMTNQTRSVDCGYGQNRCKKKVSYIDCRNECPEQLYKYGYQCLDICPKSHRIFNQTCVATCPESHPYQQRINENSKLANSMLGMTKVFSQDVKYVNVCLKQCVYPSYLVDKASNYSCVDVCPNTTRYIHLNVCSSACPKRKLTNEIKQGTDCIDTCPSKRLLFNNTCVQVCPQNTFNFNDSKCVFECPETRPFGITNGNWHCINSCDKYKLFKSGKCIFDTECKDPYFAFKNTCVNSCPDGYIWANECGKRLELTDTKVYIAALCLFIVLVVWCRLTLKEYFIVIAMILFKVDVRYEKDDVEDENGYQNDDEQPLLTEQAELEEHEYLIG